MSDAGSDPSQIALSFSDVEAAAKAYASSVSGTVEELRETRASGPGQAVSLRGVRVTRGELCLDLFPAVSWVSAPEDAGRFLFLAGSAAELARAAGGAEPLFQPLPLPMPKAGLALLWEGAFRMHARLNESEFQSREVALGSERVKAVLSISRELNGERNIPKLLSLILQRAREATCADAGSLYVVESTPDGQRPTQIQFKITQNHSTRLDLSEFTVPVNEDSIVGRCVVRQEAINITDLYSLEADPQRNPSGLAYDRSWDMRNGYECHSMLTLPVFNISHQVIGVIQLINRKRNQGATLKGTGSFAREVMPFAADDVEYGEIVAQQAGIALENALLTAEIQNLFEGFVHASVTAIEQRDPTTSGHSHRVAQLTVALARQVHDLQFGPYRAVRFTEDQFKEIEYASLLHDFGKLGVREQVLVKAKKLYPWQMELVLERFELIRASAEIEYLRKTVQGLLQPQLLPPGVGLDQWKNERDARWREIDQFLEFIRKANEPTVLEQGGFERLQDIAGLNFVDTAGKKRPYLHSEELRALSVSRGSLTREEFAEIQSHVTHTYEFLRKIPWGKNLANVPQIAAKHHEKLDGTGYPTSAEAEEIPLQSRMMSIADIFDALTASDRPYKRAVPVEKALEIIEMEVKAKKADPELFRLFVEAGVYRMVLTGGSSEPEPGAAAA